MTNKEIEESVKDKDRVLLEFFSSWDDLIKIAIEAYEKKYISKHLLGNLTDLTDNNDIYKFIEEFRIRDNKNVSVISHKLNWKNK